MAISGGEVSEAKEVSLEVVVEVVEDFNHRRIMNNQMQQNNMILDRSQMSLFTKKLEQEARSKLISETLRFHNSINNRNPMG